MGVRLVGSSESADVRIEPLAFAGTMEVRALVPPGPADVDERLACAHFRCQKGGRSRTGNDCLLCERLRGWRDGPSPSEITITCGWSGDEPVAARMTRAPAIVVISPEASCAEAVAVALADDIRHLIVAAHGRLLGVVSLRDLCPREFAEQPVERRLHRNVFALRSDATLGEAAAGFAALHIGCLPVLDEDGVVAGVITRGDLRRAGAPDSLLGARTCASCGSAHGVRRDARDDEEYCLSCSELYEELCDPRELGEGD